MQFVADKVAYALSKGLKVIACIGESLAEREAGETITVVAKQLQAIKGMPFLCRSITLSTKSDLPVALTETVACDCDYDFVTSNKPLVACDL